jgi:hypothetical protein
MMTDKAGTLTHGCVRCGAPVPLAEAMCERCNPLGLPQPAASQVHGTVFLGVGIAVVVLALLANIAVSGIGPFLSSVGSVVAVDGGLRITLSVSNEGSRAGSTTCRVHDLEGGLGPDTAFVQTPRIEPGATLTFDITTTALGDMPRPLVAECRDL